MRLMAKQARIKSQQKIYEIVLFDF
jgi:hypothetical protein